MQLPTCETKFAVENRGCGPEQPPPARSSSGEARGSGSAWAAPGPAGSARVYIPRVAGAPRSARPAPQRRAALSPFPSHKGGRAASGGRASPPPPRPLPPAPSPPPSGFLDRCTEGEGGRQREEAGGRSFLLPAERGPGPNWLSKPRHKEFPPRRASLSTESGRKRPRASPRPSARPRPQGSPPARPDGARPPAWGQPPPRPRAPSPGPFCFGDRRPHAAATRPGVGPPQGHSRRGAASPPPGPAPRPPGAPAGRSPPAPLFALRRGATPARARSAGGRQTYLGCTARSGTPAPLPKCRAALRGDF